MQRKFFLLLTTLLASCHSLQYIENSSGVLLDINKETNNEAFVNIKNYSKSFVFDMRYASSDNFLKEKVYPCAECYLRVKTVKQLIEANAEFLKKGYRIKIFDCYRPLSIQKGMWKVLPDANYVANPQNGSIHNRGNAVDITLVDSLGVVLDMGTDFDYFGEEASHNFQNLPETVLENRKLLKSIMVSNQFESFDSEWWHYNLLGGKLDKVSNKRWKCR